MKKLHIYLILQLKRVVKAFPAIIMMTFLLFGALGLLVWMKLESRPDEGAQQRVKLGIVGEDEDSYLGVGIYALEHLDSSRFTCEFLHLQEEEAREQLEAGELSAYVVIPDGFVRSIINGENKQVTFTSGSSQAGIGTVLVNQLASAVSNVVTDTQAGIYAMHEFYMDYEELKELYSDEVDLNLRYLQMILNRQNLYQLEQISVTNRLSAGGYYLCAIILLFLLLWGINCCFLFVKSDMALPRLLAAEGFGCFLQVLAEFAAYLFLMFLNYAGIAAVLLTGSSAAGVIVPEFAGVGLAEQIGFLIRILPVLPVIAAMQLLLYEIVSSLISGILLNFGLAICLAYLSGCFYPLAYFPAGIQKFAEVSPTGIAFSYMTDCYETGISARAAGLLVWLGVFLLLTTRVRKRKLEGERV